MTDIDGETGSARRAQGSRGPSGEGSIRTSVRSIRWTLRSRLAGYPRLYLPVARLRYPDAVIGADTELVIDGFTRSAVTFATIAFQMAQHRPTRVAHTLHAAGHAIAAARRGVPVLVTIRDPDETVLSAAVREPYVTLSQALAAYARFYSRLEPYREQLVIGEFDRVTRDFGSLIREVNERFGTRFDEFEHSKRDVDECYEIIEDRSRRPSWSKALGEFECGIMGIGDYRRIAAEYKSHDTAPRGKVPEHRVQRPSAERNMLKDALRDELNSKRLSRARSNAYRVHEMFVAGRPAREP